MLPKIIYVMGMPGAGKGTQAELLAHDIGYHQFSTGNAFRQIVAQDTPLGRQVKEMMENGFLTPPPIAAQVVIEFTKELVDQGKTIVFDGTPRTLEEAHIINNYFFERGYGKPLILYLEVDKDTMIERNSKRRLCLDIDKEFPVTKEEDELLCKEMGGRVGTRPDDEKEKFVTRYDQFMDLTYPVVKEYEEEQNGLFFRLDGMPAPHHVHAAVMDVINTFELPSL